MVGNWANICPKLNVSAELASCSFTSTYNVLKAPKAERLNSECEKMSTSFEDRENKNSTKAQRQERYAVYAVYFRKEVGVVG